MSRGVLYSIHPEHCEMICLKVGEDADGKPIYKKPIEVRKTKPKLPTPFKGYIYCTNGKPYLNWHNGLIYLEPKDTLGGRGCGLYKRLSGMVIGEFVCDYIDEFQVFENGSVQNWNASELEKTCLTYDELAQYIGIGNKGYACHISDLVIYENPKELSEFKTFCKSYFDSDKCDDCKFFIDGRGYEYDESDCGCDGLKPIERPPQSWCYVEVLENG